MLTQDEELWEKELPENIEAFLQRESSLGKYTKSTGRDKSKVVIYRVPQNQAVQVYDYKAKASRIIFGPDLIMLGPDEHFTYINSSGSNFYGFYLLILLSLFFVFQKFTSNKLIFYPAVFVLGLSFLVRLLMRYRVIF